VEAHAELRAAVRQVTDRFPDAYWRGLDARREYPEALVAAMTEAGTDTTSLRTTAVRDGDGGLSVFLIDLHAAIGHGLTVNPRTVMINNVTNELVFEDLRISASALVGEEGAGLSYILDGMNAERILIAAECIGNGRWFVERASERAKTREVFGRPIGDAAWKAANAAMQTFGGYSYDTEYDVERKFRGTRLFQVAPISTNLILSHIGQQVLGMPRSF
jgi:acyl-CoA dehydrogenase